jgi:hypothetical protein
MAGSQTSIIPADASNTKNAPGVTRAQENETEVLAPLVYIGIAPRNRFHHTLGSNGLILSKHGSVLQRQSAHDPAKKA